MHQDLKNMILDIKTLQDDQYLIQTDFDSYCEAQNKIDEIFKSPAELSRRSLTALAKCGDLSADKSIVQYCQSVWNIKSVEVPNPSLNPGLRVRSHSYLHLQESGSLERGDESYHSNMFNLDDVKDNIQTRGMGDVGDNSNNNF